MMRLFANLFMLLCGAFPAFAGDELALARSGDSPAFAYLLTTTDPGKPAFATILMPGGRGVLSPRMTANSRLAFQSGGDFLIRSRLRFASGPFVAASTDATPEPRRILAIAGDLQKRFGPLAVYVIGTSRSTEATMALAGPLDGQVAGFVHTSSMNAIATFDPRRFKSRHLLVSHRRDVCRVTLFPNSEAAHHTFGTELIVMEGGGSTAEDCDSRSHHGYNGIEGETVDRIKAWIEAGR
jgi:hypothetical protein